MHEALLCIPISYEGADMVFSPWATAQRIDARAHGGAGSLVPDAGSSSNPEIARHHVDRAPAT